MELDLNTIKKLSRSEILVLSYLHYTAVEGTAYTIPARIIEETSLTAPSVYAAIRGLVEKDMIKVTNKIEYKLCNYE